MAFSLKCSSVNCNKSLRHYVTIFFTLVVFSGIHASLSVAIVSMEDEAPSDLRMQIEVDYINPDAILSAFFWAYFIPLITGSKLSELWGPKWVSLTVILISSVFNIVIPAMFTNFGSTGVIVCRVIQGLCQGFLFPAIDLLIKKCSKDADRARVTHFVCSGSIFGNAISMPISGLIAGSENNWPMIFYVYGAIGILWAMIFAFFIDNELSIQSELSDVENNVEERPKKLPTPWSSVLTSLPVWAVLVAGYGHCWGAFTLLTQIPTYMYYMMRYDLSEDTNLFSLPYIVQVIVALATVPFTNKLISDQKVTTGKIRRVATSLGMFVPAIFLIVLAFLDSSQKDAALACLIVAVGISIIAQSGFFVNLTDLSPKYSTSLYLLLNLTSIIPTILGPLSVGFLGDDKKDPLLWRKVFLLSAAIYFMCGIFYNVYASGDVQQWNYEESTTDLWEKFVHSFSKMKCSRECKIRSCWTSVWNFVTLKQCRDGSSTNC